MDCFGLFLGITVTINSLFWKYRTTQSIDMWGGAVGLSRITQTMEACILGVKREFRLGWNVSKMMFLVVASFSL